LPQHGGIVATEGRFDFEVDACCAGSVAARIACGGADMNVPAANFELCCKTDVQLIADIGGVDLAADLFGFLGLRSQFGLALG